MIIARIISDGQEGFVSWWLGVKKTLNITQDLPTILNLEVFQIITDQVGRERQHKAIPSMRRAVIVLQLVGDPVLVN